MIKYKSSKLLEDFNIEKGFEKERVKEIKTKLEKLKAPTITKSVIPKKYLHYIIKHKKYCA